MWRLIASPLCIMVVARGVAAQPASSSEPIVLIEPVRVAFYEAAPTGIERSMLKAVREACPVSGRSPQSHRVVQVAPTTWLCDERGLRFFRGVDVLGNHQKTGLVCRYQSVAPNLKYYTEDMFGEEAECLPIAYEVAAKRHILDSTEVAN